MEKRKVGRPIQKIGRVKIGMSIDGKTNDYLTELSINSGKTKSKILEESIALYYENNKELQDKIVMANKLKDDPYFHFRDVLKKSLDK
jgi:predicted DNA-binding protein